MSAFPRIDPKHPLAEAARQTNAQAEEIGLEATLDWLDMDVSPEELGYLGEQRALRAVAASGLGLNLNPGDPLTESVAQAILLTPLWNDMRRLLVSCYLDGIAIGWRGHQLAMSKDDREREA